MAVVAVTGNPVVGIKYTVTTASSADWASVSNSTYFYDLTDKLVHYKDSTGTVLEIYGASVAATTGSVISFTTPQVYNTPASPSASDLTDSLTGAVIGIVQKIYHNKAVAPTVPAGWVLIGTGTYTTSTLNIIFAEWVSGTRIEYWIVKPA
jgi:hypothetical protein